MTGDPTQPNDPARPGGATWCQDHQRWECTRNVKQSRGGGRCHGPSITGTDACRMHVGKRTELAKAQGQAITAWSALSGQATISSTEAVLGMLQMSWLRAHTYAQLLEEQVSAAQQARRQNGDGDGFGGGSGDVGAGAGLVGHTYGSTKDSVYASGEAVRGLAQLEAAERDRCVRYAKAAHDMGIAEAQVKIAEGQGRLLAEVIRRVLDRLELTDQQRAQVPLIVPGELRAIEGGAS